MSATQSPCSYDLAAGAPLVLEHATGARVTVCRGTVWLTQYGDARDHVLHAGQSFEIEVPACVVVSGVGEARVSVAAAAMRAPERKRWRWPLRWDRSEHAVMVGAVRRLRLG